MRRLAVLVAAEEYQNFTPTPFCHADAELLYKTLVEDCDYAEQDVLLKLLAKDSTATPAELIDEIKSAVGKAEPGDTVLFFYAGHGDFVDGDSYLILPSTEVGAAKKTSALPLRDVSHTLRQPRLTNVRVFDTCHSGFDVRANGDDEINASGFLRSVVTEAAEGWVTFAGCKADEFSHSDQNLGQGIFTHSFCDSIRSRPAGEEMSPEILKIETCNRVSAWTQKAGKTQTPTLNASISGNISIATRVDRRPEQPRSTPSSEDVEGELLTRLDCVRRFGSVGDKEHITALQKLMADIYRCVSECSAAVQRYGCRFEVAEPADIRNLPSSFRPRIVSFVDGAKLRPVHNIGHRREYEGDDRTRLSSIALAAMSHFERKFTDHYTVEQPYGWPASYVSLRLHSDGYVPNVLGFVYLVPLQVRALVLTGVAAGDTSQTTDPTWSKPSLWYRYIDLHDDSVPHMTPVARNLITKFAEQVRQSLADRLKYLEYEIATK